MTVDQANALIELVAASGAALRLVGDAASLAQSAAAG
jgi:hypothetical protein